MRTAADQVLQVSSVSKTFSRRRGGGLDALVGVSLSLRRGEVLGVVGESGSGKTTLARCIAGLAWLSAGSIEVAGISWSSHPARRDRRSLARHVQLVFQDPYSSLNPRMKVGSLVAEGMIVHKLCQSRDEQRRRAAGLLEQVGLSPQLASAYARELSGGQRRARRDRPCPRRRAVGAGPRRAGLLARSVHPGSGTQPDTRRDRQWQAGRAVHLARPRRGAFRMRPGDGDAGRWGRRAGRRRGRPAAARAPLPRELLDSVPGEAPGGAVGVVRQ